MEVALYTPPSFSSKYIDFKTRYDRDAFIKHCVPYTVSFNRIDSNRVIYKPISKIDDKRNYMSWASYGLKQIFSPKPYKFSGYVWKFPTSKKNNKELTYFELNKTFLLPPKFSFGLHTVPDGKTIFFNPIQITEAYVFICPDDFIPSESPQVLYESYLKRFICQDLRCYTTSFLFLGQKTVYFLITRGWSLIQVNEMDSKSGKLPLFPSFPENENSNDSDEEFDKEEQLDEKEKEIITVTPDIDNFWKNLENELDVYNETMHQESLSQQPVLQSASQQQQLLPQQPVLQSAPQQQQKQPVLHSAPQQQKQPPQLQQQPVLQSAPPQQQQKQQPVLQSAPPQRQQPPPQHSSNQLLLQHLPPINMAAILENLDAETLKKLLLTQFMSQHKQ